MSRWKYSPFFDCYFEVFSNRENKKEQKRQKFFNYHRRYKAKDRWLRMLIGGRYR